VGPVDEDDVARLELPEQLGIDALERLTHDVVAERVDVATRRRVYGSDLGCETAVAPGPGDDRRRVPRAHLDIAGRFPAAYVRIEARGVQAREPAVVPVGLLGPVLVDLDPEQIVGELCDRFELGPIGVSVAGEDLGQPSVPGTAESIPRARVGAGRAFEPERVRRIPVEASVESVDDRYDPGAEVSPRSVADAGHAGSTSRTII
jgi:hypothetical protein